MVAVSNDAKNLGVQKSLELVDLISFVCFY